MAYKVKGDESFIHFTFYQFSAMHPSDKHHIESQVTVNGVAQRGSHCVSDQSIGQTRFSLSGVAVNKTIEGDLSFKVAFKNNMGIKNI